MADMMDLEDWIRSEKKFLARGWQKVNPL
jgi:hypothetical protein